MLKEKIKALKNISFGEFYQKVFDASFVPILVLVAGLFVLLVLLISFGSAIKIELYPETCVYISFFLSFLIFVASLFEKIKSLNLAWKTFLLILFIFLSIGYAIIRVKCFTECKQFEDLGTVVILLFSYASIFRKSKQHEGAVE